MYHHLNTGLEITKIKMILTTKHKSVSFGHNHCMAIWQKTTDYDFFLNLMDPQPFFFCQCMSSLCHHHGGGGGGCSVTCEDLGECLTNYSLPAFFCFVFCLKWRLACTTLIPLFTSGLAHSGSASWDDCDRVFPDEFCVSLTLTECSLTSCVWACFFIGFPHYAWTAA